MAAADPDLTASSTAGLAPAVLRYLAVPLLFGVGAVHLYEYLADHYSVIPVIGDLFLANFAIAVLLGLALAAPLASLPFLRSLPIVRSVPLLGRAPHVPLALAGIPFLLGTIIGLIISEAGTLFGFHEYGYRTTVSLALGLESAAVVALAGFVALEVRRARARRGAR